MEKSKAFVIDSNFWILSYVDFMTVIMAFFISFTLIATKVATATELFIVKKIDKITKLLESNITIFLYEAYLNSSIKYYMKKHNWKGADSNTHQTQPKNRE